MSNVFNEYPASNGVGPYSITFEYQRQEDVVVLYRNPENERYDVQSNNDWSFVNATTIELNAAPSADYDIVRIQRSTDVNPLRALFYPGSAIRAQDLNANFEQLMMAIEEEQQSLTDTSDYIDQFFWNKLEDTVETEDQTSGRVISDNLIDDDYIFTTGASAARHDAYVQETKPEELTYQQTGKLWQNTDNCWTSYWQNSIDPNNNNDPSETWVAYVNTGPRGEQGPQGPPGQSIVGPPGPEGPEGQPGQNGGTFPDAPADGTLYGRKDNDWEEVATVAQATYTFVAPLKEVNHVVTLDLLTIPNAP